MRSLLRQVVLAVSALGLAGSAFAAADYDKPSVSFSCVFGDCATDLSGQLSLEVIGDKNGEDPNVYFKFFNDAGIQSSITQISFSALPDLTVLHPVVGSNPLRGTGTGTEFQLSFHGVALDIADELPTGALPFTASWTARSVGAGAGGIGGIANGVNVSGEAFELIASAGGHPDYLTFLHAIQQGEIRVGVVTEGYANGLSATYVTNAVPEPATYLTLFLGLAGLAAMRRRRK